MNENKNKEIILILGISNKDFKKQSETSPDTKNALVSLCFTTFLKAMNKEGLISSNTVDDLKFMLTDYVETFENTNNFDNDFLFI